jgi:hypothetical protein
VEKINLSGKTITVRSTDLNNPSIVNTTVEDGNGAGSVVTFSSGEGSGSVLEGITIRNGGGCYGLGTGQWQKKRSPKRNERACIPDG